MKVELSRRAIADLGRLADEATEFGAAAAEGLGKRLSEVLAHIAQHPRAGPPVEGRPGVHVYPLIRYPYKVFYRVFAERVLILHIRHAARHPWKVPR